MQPYKLWWMTKEKNYGDLLSPYIFDFFKIPYVNASRKDANVLCIGSIISLAKKDTIVLGSGIIDSSNKASPYANYKFVRGPRTRQKILDNGGSCPPIYGDSALLLPLMCKESNKEYDIGIVPHVSHYAEALKKYPNYKIINLETTNPLEVCKEITKCKKIISSSLHGIITAHAYGIPAAWIKFSTDLFGDDIKFKDYYESVGLKAEVSSIESPKFTVGNIDIKKIEEIFRNL